MILEFSKELAELERVLGIQVPRDKVVEISFIFAGIMDHAMALEQKRIIKIIQLKAANPRELVREIERPIR
jgi:hypothetical protein